MSRTTTKPSLDLSYWSERRTSSGVVVARYDNSPRNYFCASAAAELGVLIDSWADPAVRAVVITGAVDGAFITHYSVEELSPIASNPAALEETGTTLSFGYHDLLAGLRRLPKPVIAAINGDCMGGGLELAVWCDIRIAQRGDHRIGLPETRLGIIPGGSGTQMLSRLIGTSRALTSILLGSIYTPDAAQSIGLVHETVDDALTRSLAVAEDLSSLNPVALAMAKKAVLDGADLPLAEGLIVEAQAFLETMRSSGARETMENYVATPLDGRRSVLDSRTARSTSAAHSLKTPAGVE